MSVTFGTEENAPALCRAGWDNGRFSQGGAPLALGWYARTPLACSMSKLQVVPCGGKVLRAPGPVLKGQTGLGMPLGTRLDAGPIAGVEAKTGAGSQAQQIIRVRCRLGENTRQTTKVLRRTSGSRTNLGQHGERSDRDAP